MSRKCKKCGEIKPLNAFNKHYSCKDGFNTRCKECIKDAHRSLKGRINRIYYDQHIYSKKRGHHPPNYTRDELATWMYANGYEELHKKWVESGYIKALSPSCDRLDNKKGYSLDNIQLVTWKINHRNNTGDTHGSAKVLDYYKTYPINRANFKQVCIRRNWSFDDFTEVFNHTHTSPSGSSYSKYTYHLN
jgi:hypothetical protein